MEGQPALNTWTDEGTNIVLSEFEDAAGTSVTIQSEDDADDSGPDEGPPRMDSLHFAAVESRPAMLPFLHYDGFKVHNKNTKPILVLSAAANAITDIVNLKGSWNVGVPNFAEVGGGLELSHVPRSPNAGDRVINIDTVRPGQQLRIQVQRGTDPGIVVDIMDLHGFWDVPVEQRKYHCHKYVKRGTNLTISGDADIPANITGFPSLLGHP